MTTGAWILLASVLLAVGVGAWRAYADGRFRGTHAVAGADSSSGRVAAGRRDDEPAGPDTTSAAPAPEPLLRADQLGERATLLQFSSAFCAPCRATRRVLTEVAEVVPGVTHVEIDAEHHLDLVRRVGVLRTPTTLVLDATGQEAARAAGAPTRDAVLATLARVTT